MSKIAICGASGLVGSLLAKQLKERGDSICVIGRNSDKLKSEFPNADNHWTWEEFKNATTYDLDVVVNLAGAGVMDKRWDAEYKKIMVSSRVESTKTCTDICASHPHISLINASSVHAYGVHSEDHRAFVEGDAPDTGKDCFLYELFTQWEGATASAVARGARVSLLRLGVVLATEGGALEETVKPFRMFVGGRHGSGRQIMSWISLSDLVNAILFLIDTPSVDGPVNMVAPTPCTNSEFATAIGNAINRPSALPMPGFILRAIMGQAGQELVLLGQRVLPKKLLDAGFKFQDQNIDVFLRQVLN